VRVLCHATAQSHAIRALSHYPPGTDPKFVSVPDNLLALASSFVKGLSGWTLFEAFQWSHSKHGKVQAEGDNPSLKLTQLSHFAPLCCPSSARDTFQARE
jgi:hypothetical protein